MVGYRSTAAKFYYGNWIRPVMGERSEQFRGHIHENANYIIEPQTDFIFAVAGEELGFIGTMVIVLLLLFIVIECILIARKAKDLAGRLICCGMAALIGFQSILIFCCHRSDAEYRNSASICKLRINLFAFFVFGNGVCIKCRITAEKY